MEIAAIRAEVYFSMSGKAAFSSVAQSLAGAAIE
jgi:hypothetical protein